MIKFCQEKLKMFKYNQEIIKPLNEAPALFKDDQNLKIRILQVSNHCFIGTNWLTEICF